ncbi:hypothetical protein QJS04_geneDACA002130 [Acorus gramineus]|uniref:HMA domain-containing protein n=1 Tax=Acorus gramineus TaxID=55184 RepID=A0AAV9A9X0_ACOGR|nr:hypothetical protein QJS04_geneDACA002130 [Acorus gramineus]
MGEKEGKGNGDEKKKADGGGGGGGGKKDEGGPIFVVMKIDMHCEGCAKKVKRAVKGFEGVEDANADSINNKLTAVGKVDPWELRERLEKKINKKVELISPTPPKKPQGKDGKGDDNKNGSDDKGDGKPADKKPKEAQPTTVVLKIRLHCEGCIHKIRRIIYKIKGVQHVAIDSQKDLVTVKGTMDVKELPLYLKEKLKRGVEVVPPKKDDGGEKKEKAKEGGEKKEKAKEGGEKKEEKAKEGGEKKEEKAKEGGEKKEEKKEGGEKKEKAKEVVEAVKAEANKMEYSGYGYGHGYGQGYNVQYVHAPQIFSDENPNACSVM